jgi:mannose-6-phosphate isomerase-like protein (cupin superfamily)
MKTAKWQDLSFEQQQQYMKHHPKTKFHVTGMPSDPQNIELFNIKKTMNGLNSVVEGKLPIVQEKANEWSETLQSLGFEKVKESEESTTLVKDDLQAEVGVKKGKMRYFSYFEIKPMEVNMEKAATINDENIINFVKAATADDSKKGLVIDIEKETANNNNFRKVIYTGEHSQLVLMSLNPGEEIGEEIHEETDQFFRIDKGSGFVVINDEKHTINDGFAIVIPAGAKHNVIAGKDGLKLYSIYSPPHHADKTIHKTKEDVEEEHFDGKTTE